MNDWIAPLLVFFVVTPFVVYVSTQLAYYGYMRAKQNWKDRYPNHLEESDGKPT